jgi:hypothetical protein
MAQFPIKPSSAHPEPPEAKPFYFSLRAMMLSPWQRSLLWGVGLLVALVVPAVAGIIAVRHLLKIADPPDCRANLSSDSSLSARLYCADEVAKDSTVEGLRDAIKLVSSIPGNDPLRATGDRRIEQWSQTLLNLGETAYQEGDLDKAINIARTIPISSRVYPTASDRMNQWKQYWEKAEDIYRETQNAVQKQDWTEALNTARALVKLGNRYWETTKYQELLNQVQEGKEQQKSERTAAEKARVKSGQVITKWERGFEADAVAHLKKANELARSGSLKGLKAAIEEAQLIYYGTPTYDEAQKQIEIWQRQAETIEDRYHLDRAIRLASRGNQDSLQAAIDEAFMVSPTGNLYEEARSRIDQWMDQLYRIKYPAPGNSASTQSTQR